MAPDQNRVLRVLILTFLAMSAAIALLGVGIGDYRHATVGFVAAAGWIVLLFAQNRWGAGWCGYVCTIWYFLPVIGSVVTGSGIHDIAMVLFPPGLFLGALVLNRRHVLPMILLVLLTVAGVGFLSLRHPPSPIRNNVPTVISTIILLGVSGALAFTIVGTLRETVLERQHAEKNLRTLIEDAPISISVTREGRFLYANPKMLRTFMIDNPESIIGQPSADLYALRYREESRNRTRRRGLGLPAPAEFDSVCLRSDGSEFPVHVSVADVALADGPAHVGFIVDTTELNRAKAYVENLIETANVLIVELDIDGHATRLNRMGHEITGYTADDFQARTWFEVLAPPSDHRAPDQLIALRSGQMVDAGEAAIITRDGRERIIAWRNSHIRTASGENAGVISFGVDVTDIRRVEAERQRLQQAMLEAVKEWSGTFNAVDTPILIAHRDGSVIRVNRAALELTGRDEVHVVGENIADLGSSEPWQTAAQMIKFISDERSGTAAETRDDFGRTWDVTITHFSEEDHSDRYILVFWNTTGIVELQESLRRSETMSAMGTIVAGVAHEVRNPLFGISATLDAYDDELGQPGYQECAGALRTEVIRLQQLMQELLEYGKPSTLNIRRGGLRPIISEAVAHRKAAGVTVEISVPDDLPDLLADRDRLRQVFENLVDNASKFSPSVHAKASVVQRYGRSWIECRVEDHGPGFAPDDLDRVFEPFYSRREGGTGLGLSIVQRIVQDHSGRVFAENREEGGARVTILLPLAERAQART